uniref:Contactin associated protein like 3 n=1 Tax=Takifugu rubripes TaxID=31033 RepID=A0A674P8X8_TAKRU
IHSYDCEHLWKRCKYPAFCTTNRSGGWSPLASDRYQWLEADLGERTKVTAVATQGRYGSSDWLTSYLLMFSDTGHNWKQYRQEDSLGSFPGNSNADSVVQYKLQQPVVARFLRLIPLGWNPNGRIGLRLEAYGCPYTSDVASLDGGSSLTYSPSPALKRTFRDVVTLKFKTVRNSGMLLHAGGAGGLGLSLELERGKLQLLLRQGQASSAEPRRLASLGSLLDDQHWHRVAVERRGVHLNVTVDKHTEKVRRVRFAHAQLNVGGGPGLGPETPGRSGRNFHGCLENLLYNGHSLIDLVKQKSRQVAVAGNVTFSCDEPLSVAVTFPGPQSFLQLPGVPASSSGSFSVGFQFRTWNGAGLLLTFALPQEGGVVWLYLSEARLRLQIHKAGRVLLELSAGWALNDGQWHQAELKSRRGRLSIVVDKEERSSAHASHSLPVAIESSIFFGGCPTEGDVQGCRNPFHVFQGCMSLLTLDDQKVNLILVQQKQLGTYGNLQLDIGAQSPCEHGGRCTQSWTGFHCNCSDSGYSGATCHSSAYERSCEAYKHAGSTSGHFYIDVDGSGPIGPQLVYCNMTEGNTWMEVPHNNTELTRVGAAPDANQRSVYFDYAAGEEQLAAAIGQSEHCQQELSYHCRKSRLLNTPEGSPFSWWVGGPGPGRVQTYWGGAQPGSQQCACGLQGDCVDPQHYCNCDADRAEWAQDSGPLAHKESLPVRSLLLGDIQRPGSEAAYRVGPLRCHGDRGTASRQKGFRGCIRSLQLNGVTLDLEERASITPGVQPGCPGHCSSYGSFCQNHGRCVERVNGFHCDCGLSAHAGVFCHTEVSASFKPATSVSYTFKEPYEQVRNSSAVPSSIYTDVTLRGENVTLSFRTFQSPAVLFYVSSYHREFLAVLINKHGEEEENFSLSLGTDGIANAAHLPSEQSSGLFQIDQNPREDFNLTSDGEFNAIKSLVLGKVHGEYEQRSDDLDPDLLRLGSLGFAGCLSVVRFNSISPLKAALLHPDTSPVTITGPLLRSGCGSASANPSATEDTHLLTDQSGSAGSGQPLVNAIRTDSALIGGVIAVAIFLMVAGLAIAGRFLYRRKETYRNQEVKGVKQEDGPDFPFSSQAESQDASEENPKEYFI